MHMPANADATDKQFGLRCRRDNWNELRKAVGLTTDEALADVFHVAQSTITRVLAGRLEPSSKFIATALITFPFCTFDRLFQPYVRATR